MMYGFTIPAPLMKVRIKSRIVFIKGLRNAGYNRCECCGMWGQEKYGKFVSPLQKWYCKKCWTTVTYL